MFVLTKVDVSNIHDEKIGRPQRSQFQDTLCKPLYIMVFIPIQSLWYQVSHESQHTPTVFQVTALLQEPQGYLSVLGPGFGSGAYEFANNMAQRYNNTSNSGFNLFRSTCLMM